MTIGFDRVLPTLLRRAHASQAGIGGIVARKGVEGLRVSVGGCVDAAGLEVNIAEVVPTPGDILRGRTAGCNRTLQRRDGLVDATVDEVVPGHPVVAGEVGPEGEHLGVGGARNVVAAEFHGSVAERAPTCGVIGSEVGHLL